MSIISVARRVEKKEHGKGVSTKGYRNGSLFCFVPQVEHRILRFAAFLIVSRYIPKQLLCSVEIRPLILQINGIIITPTHPLDVVLLMRGSIR